MSDPINDPTAEQDELIGKLREAMKRYGIPLSAVGNPLFREALVAQAVRKAMGRKEGPEWTASETEK